MPDILSTINDVSVTFAGSVNKDVTQTMIDGLKHCIKSDVSADHSLHTIWISSAKDSHESPSRHVDGKAVDISRINGVKIVTGYSSDSAIKAIVNAIQDTFETYSQRRENFGPYFKKKLGKPWKVGGHDDHIHLSVN